LKVIKSTVRTRTTQQPNPDTDVSRPTEELLRFIPTQQHRVLKELEEYLNDPLTDLEMLQKYPKMRKLFIRFNIPIPSSAPVERLFSIGRGYWHFSFNSP